MSKAVFVIDKPKSCFECALSHRLDPESMMDCRGERISDTSAIFNKIPGHCPLRPMPEKKQNACTHGFAGGWNACIDAIGGGYGE